MSARRVSLVMVARPQTPDPKGVLMDARQAVERARMTIAWVIDRAERDVRLLDGRNFDIGPFADAWEALGWLATALADTERVVEAARALSTYESLVASGDLARTRTVDVLHRNVLRDALARFDFGGQEGEA